MVTKLSSLSTNLRRVTSLLTCALVFLFATPAWALKVDSGSLTLPINSSAVGETWEAITFGLSFDSPPAVFVSPGPSAGGDPFTVRIQNVTANGFEAQTVEPSGPNGAAHAAVKMIYLAIEYGTFALPSGEFIEINSFTTVAQQFAANHGLTSSWDSVALAAPFASAPILLTQLQTTANETGAVPTEHSIPFLTTVATNVTAHTTLECSTEEGAGKLRPITSPKQGLQRI